MTLFIGVMVFYPAMLMAQAMVAYFEGEVEA
jgi:hypothetical protein